MTLKEIENERETLAADVHELKNSLFAKCLLVARDEFLREYEFAWHCAHRLQYDVSYEDFPTEARKTRSHIAEALRVVRATEEKIKNIREELERKLSRQGEKQ